MTKFTRSRKEIIKYLNQSIKCYRKFIFKGTVNENECIRSINDLKNIKRFMTKKTDWI